MRRTYNRVSAPRTLPDDVSLMCVRDIDGGKPEVGLKEHPAGGNLRDRVYETCARQCLANEVAHISERHGHDHLRNVSGRDCLLWALLRLHLAHKGSVSPSVRGPS